MKFRLLDLFSGIGGFSLGLERSGYFETEAFCEIDKYARRVLAAHWPKVPCYDDVQKLDRNRLVCDGVAADIVCGGFPCQDASIANTVGTGTEGSRTRLFLEMVRIAGEMGSRYIVMENVPELLNRGFGNVLGALAKGGFDAEWDCFSARDCGLDHERDRLFIVAYASGEGRKGSESYRGILVAARTALAEHVYDAANARRAVAGDKQPLRNPDGLSVAMERRRLHGLGNAVVPLIPQAIGKAIGDYERALVA